jgi:aspartate aminotransferase
LGVAIGPDNIITAIENLVSTIVSCVPPFVQVAGIEAITGNQLPALKMAATYKRRAELLVNGLNKIKG